MIFELIAQTKKSLKGGLIFKRTAGLNLSCLSDCGKETLIISPSSMDCIEDLARELSHRCNPVHSYRRQSFQRRQLSTRARNHRLFYCASFFYRVSFGPCGLSFSAYRVKKQ